MSKTRQHRSDPISATMQNRAVFVLLIGVVSSARLDYLPPGLGGRGTSGAYGTKTGSYGVGYKTAGGASTSGSYGAAGGAFAGASGAYNGVGGAFAGSSGGYSGAGRFTGAGASGQVIPIISYENNPNQGDGSYYWSYATANEIRAQEEGYLNQNAPEGPGEAAQGSFSFTAPDGQQFTVTYTADENGFVPQGAHLPTPPPIPQEILESLQKNAADEAAGIYDDGSYQGDGPAAYGGSPGYGGGAKYGGGSGGAYGTGSPGAYGTGSPGAYGTGSAGAYGAGSAGAYGAGSGGAYGTGSAGAYGAGSGGGYVSGGYGSKSGYAGSKGY